MTKEELLQVAKPILFNTEMVKAILEGRKTVTRRCVKYKYDNTEMKMHTDKYGTRLIEIQRDVEGETHGKNPDGSTWHKLLAYIEKTAPFKKGDILYVRETWGCYQETWADASYFLYRADYPEGATTYLYSDGEHVCDLPKWKPSIHMPKEATRIFLKVKDVRVERLQEITEPQAEREGIRGYSKDGKLYKYAVTDDWWIGFHEKHRKSFTGSWWQDMPRTARKAFSYLWNSTIKKEDFDTYGWDASPYVWVIEFERIEVE